MRWNKRLILLWLKIFSRSKGSAYFTNVCKIADKMIIGFVKVIMLRTAGNSCLYRRTLYRTIAAKHTTVALLWFKSCLTIWAFIKVLASACWHCLFLFVFTSRASDNWLKYDCLFHLFVVDDWSYFIANTIYCFCNTVNGYFAIVKLNNGVSIFIRSVGFNNSVYFWEFAIYVCWRICANVSYFKT